jgi:hypothetical protein
VYYQTAALSCAFFMWEKGLNAKDIKKINVSCLWWCLSHKAIHNWVEKFLKDVQKSQMMPNQVRKWLRQQSKDFYAAGFDALVKRWDKCINVGGGYVEK